MFPETGVEANLPARPFPIDLLIDLFLRFPTAVTIGNTPALVPRITSAKPARLLSFYVFS